MSPAAFSAEQHNGQLSLDLGLLQDEDAAPPPDKAGRPIVKTMLFPRHVKLPHFGQIERQLTQAFAPFGIDIEFRFTRQNRLEMKWVFASELNEQPEFGADQIAAFAQLAQPAVSLSDAERQAFEAIMIDFEDA